jgi:hypothetical protein
MNGESSAVSDLGRAWVLRLFYRQLAVKRWLRSGAPDPPPPDVASLIEGVRTTEPLPPTLTGLAALLEGRFTRAR